MTAAARWLLPADQYRAAGFAALVQSPETETPRVAVPNWPVCDGPAARALDASLRPRLPDGLVTRRREDYGVSPHTAATVRYRGKRGGALRVLRRRLSVPLLLDAFSDPAHRCSVRTRPTGTEVVRTDDEAADLHRLVMARPNGTLFVIESMGIPTAGIPAPVSGDELDRLEAALDTSATDIEPVGQGPSTLHDRTEAPAAQSAPGVDWSDRDTPHTGRKNEAREPSPRS